MPTSARDKKFYLYIYYYYILVRISQTFLKLSEIKFLCVVINCFKKEKKRQEKKK